MLSAMVAVGGGDGVPRSGLRSYELMAAGRSDGSWLLTRRSAGGKAIKGRQIGQVGCMYTCVRACVSERVGSRGTEK